MAVWTGQRREVTIRNLGHARSVLVNLDHIPSMFGGQPGQHLHATCGACGRKAWLAGNRMAGSMVDARCPSSGWADSEGSER